MKPPRAAASETPAFLGRGWAFPPRFDVTVSPLDATPVGQPAMVSGATDIDQSLEVLMFTLMGERIMRPTYGIGLQLDVFMAMDQNDLTLLRRRIEKAILFFEPRITDVIVLTDPSTDDEDGRLDIGISYRVTGTNTRGNRVFPFFLDEATHAPG